MDYPFFTGKRQTPLQEGHQSLPASRQFEQTLPENYDTDEGLIDAVNVALLMARPLLLTGEPGTGKTQLAYRIAWELGFDTPLKFETKSNSSARDLFYYYDSLARFHDAQIQAGRTDSRSGSSGAKYIRFNALGTAIIRSIDKEKFEYKHLLTDDFNYGKCRRSVVLLDEIDKAPRDFPNDILNEIENMYFRIPEMGNIKIEADREMSPVVIITSNSEKHLPDAFLRRCIFYNIEFPDLDRMEKIVEKRLKDLINLKTDSNAYVSDALDLFYYLRDPHIGLKKRPSTAELLVWLDALSRMSKSDNPIMKDEGHVTHSLGVLVKSVEDLKIVREKFDQWLKDRKA